MPEALLSVKRPSPVLISILKSRGEYSSLWTCHMEKIYWNDLQMGDTGDDACVNNEDSGQRYGQWFTDQPSDCPTARITSILPISILSSSSMWFVSSVTIEDLPRSKTCHIAQLLKIIVLDPIGYLTPRKPIGRHWFCAEFLTAPWGLL